MTGKDSGFYQNCPLCNFNTSNSFNWNVHLTTLKHRAKSKGLTCYDCGAIYESKGQLTRHIKNTHEKRQKRVEEFLHPVSLQDQASVQEQVQASVQKQDQASVQDQARIKPQILRKIRPSVRPRTIIPSRCAKTKK